MPKADAPLSPTVALPPPLAPETTVPWLNPDRIREALISGGLEGLVKAFEAEANPENRCAKKFNAIRKVLHSETFRTVRHALTQYRNGAPVDHRAILEDLSPHVLALAILAESAAEALRFIEANPGRLQSLGDRSRRVFDFDPAAATR